MTINKTYDVIIVGGSYAGLSAAMALGRSMKKVLIIDSGLACNRQTPHSHNFITQDGEKPADIAAKAKEQVLRYETVTFVSAVASAGKKTEKGFTIATQDGEEFIAEKLIFASGIKDVMPDIKGFSECWGISVIHCPYCHGYEFRGKKTAIMTNGEKAFHLASLVSNLTGDLTILTTGNPAFDDRQISALSKRGIKIIENEITEIEHENGQVKNVLFRGADKMKFDAVYAVLRFEQHSDIPVSLGCELTETGHVKIDAFQQTTVEGVFACGDNSSALRTVANAVYSGNLAGSMVNRKLTEERFHLFPKPRLRNS
ncbi:MAG: NAD(P)/FAD-dependent oxidoreductase [Bacteroidetes bacterium]|nr:NAD(P)/FAD-dependent oxidoreductase [Bacteroidota bacterium]